MLTIAPLIHTVRCIKANLLFAIQFNQIEYIWPNYYDVPQSGHIINFFSHYCLHFILQTINIMVNTGNRTLSLPVETASLVSRVMEQIQENAGIATETRHLIFAGKQLKEDIRLYMYGVQQGSPLHMNALPNVKRSWCSLL